MTESDDFQGICKVVIIGDSGVGKSNLMTRFVNNDFSLETSTTIGVDLLLKDVKIRDAELKVQIWDTAGQEKYRSITRPMYRGCRGAMVVFDITNRQSFDNVGNWLEEVHKYAPPDVAIILVGNKTDLAAQRQVPESLAMKFAADRNLFFMETSALANDNVDKAFDWLAREMYLALQNVKPKPGPAPGPPTEENGESGPPKPAAKESKAIRGITLTPHAKTDNRTGTKPACTC